MDAKNELHNWLYVRGLPLPHYRYLRVTGEVFFACEIEVYIPPHGKRSFQGYSDSKKKASQAAALRALDAINNDYSS